VALKSQPQKQITTAVVGDSAIDVPRLPFKQHIRPPVGSASGSENDSCGAE